MKRAKSVGPFTQKPWFSQTETHNGLVYVLFLSIFFFHVCPAFINPARVTACCFSDMVDRYAGLA